MVLPQEERDWFYDDQVAAANHLSVETIRRRCKDGRLSADKAGNTRNAPWQIRREALEAAHMRVPGDDIGAIPLMQRTGELCRKLRAEATSEHGISNVAAIREAALLLAKDARSLGEILRAL